MVLKTRAEKERYRHIDEKIGLATIWNVGLHSSFIDSDLWRCYFLYSISSYVMIIAMSECVSWTLQIHYFIVCKPPLKAKQRSKLRKFDILDVFVAAPVDIERREYCWALPFVRQHHRAFDIPQTAKKLCKLNYCQPQIKVYFSFYEKSGLIEVPKWGRVRVVASVHFELV